MIGSILNTLCFFFGMSLIHDILSQVGQMALGLISSFGYAGVFVLMMLESMIMPVPSELVMPFAGFLIADRRFTFLGVLLASSLGSIVGSLISYYIGYYGGNKFVLKFGKYLLLDEDDLKKTEQWFASCGEKTVLISRFIPVVRHLISIPAGIGRMNLKKFCIYTLLGATMWNGILMYAGFKLGEHWQTVRQYSEPMSMVMAVVIVVAGGYFVYRHVKHKTIKKK